MHLLEGDKCTTISLIPMALKILKDGLLKITNDIEMLQAIVNLSNTMLTKFDEEFLGTGYTGTYI